MNKGIGCTINFQAFSRISSFTYSLEVTASNNSLNINGSPFVRLNITGLMVDDSSVLFSSELITMVPDAKDHDSNSSVFS